MNHILAQGYDTVVIKLEPLIVKKRIVVQEKMPTPKRLQNIELSDWSLALGYQWGKIDVLQTKDSIYKSFTVHQGPMFSVCKAVDPKWYLSLGIGYNSSAVSTAYTEKRIQVDTVLKMHIDSTLTGISISIPEGIVYKYDYDTTYRKELAYTQYHEQISNKDRIDQWQIPLQLAYRIEYKDMYLLPNLSINYHFSTRSTLFSSDKKLPLPKHHASVAIGLQAGIKIWKHLGLEVGGRYQQQVRSARKYIKQNYVIGNVSLRYFF